MTTKDVCFCEDLAPGRTCTVCEWKPISPKSHASLLAYGWSMTEPNSYTHPELDGHAVVITGHRDVGGGRRKLTWGHSCPASTIGSEGCEALEMHLAYTAKRAGLVDGRGYPILHS